MEKAERFFAEFKRKWGGDDELGKKAKPFISYFLLHYDRLPTWAMAHRAHALGCVAALLHLSPQSCGLPHCRKGQGSGGQHVGFASPDSMRCPGAPRWWLQDHSAGAEEKEVDDEQRNRVVPWQCPQGQGRLVVGVCIPSPLRPLLRPVPNNSACAFCLSYEKRLISILPDSGGGESAWTTQCIYC